MSCRSTTSASMPVEHRRGRAARLAVERVDRQAGLLVGRRRRPCRRAVPRMPCSGLKSATSFTSFAPKSTSIVVAPSRATPGVIGDQADALPAQRREAVGAQHVDAGQHRRATDGGGTVPDGAEVTAGPAPRVRGRRRQARHRGRGDGRDARAQRRHVALAVRMHAVRQEDDEHPGRRIDPDRRAGEAGVPERSDRQQLAAVRRERRIDVPAEAPRCSARGRAWRRSSSSRPPAATGCARL